MVAARKKAYISICTELYKIFCTNFAQILRIVFGLRQGCVSCDSVDYMCQNVEDACQRFMNCKEMLMGKKAKPEKQAKVEKNEQI